MTPSLAQAVSLRVLQTIWVLAAETGPRVRMQMKYDDIEWQRFSDKACYDQTSSSQGMNHAVGCFSTARMGY